MKKYELVLILSAKQDKKEQKKITDKITKLVSDFKGKSDKLTPWGQKEFAFPIKKQTKGDYYIFSFSLPAAEAPKFENKVKTEEKILRYLLIKQA
jgi:small subunit ribosomal protein S6